MNTNEIIRNLIGKRVLLYTMNGVLLRGRVLDTDETALKLIEGSRTLLIFIHAISTVVLEDGSNDRD